ncbi:unnamed protein product [Spodoptera littoralis]|uniref:Uncharacterized protein n=1 Tax=Spodoptera littoralis TaxID=7109 RepID=A0A9P0I7T5_SPOLI|nr:unnamed protein product [Spodoptera littoralis]CAH1641754.1 unnamed protein product [Spodoptera littoralis]
MDNSTQDIVNLPNYEESGTSVEEGPAQEGPSQEGPTQEGPNESFYVMLNVLAIFIFIKVSICFSYDFDDYDHQPKARGAPSADDIEFEPVMTLTKDKEKLISMKNINCDNFAEYAHNCTTEAAMSYNSVKKSPPMPGQVYDWCKAIRHLTNCAIDWNSDCKDVTESHFNEESIRGHMHVVNNICNDEQFLSRYDELPNCIEGSADAWEKCYAFFKSTVDEQKNTTHEWTHFETHFHMCCARAKFRRCTADALFDMPKTCPYEQAVTLQQFSAIVSEGDVFQSYRQKFVEPL